MSSNAGVVAGVCAKLLTMPFDTVRRRLQVVDIATRADLVGKHEGGSAWSVAKRLVQREGVRALWRGTLPSIIKAGAGSWATFVGFETLVILLEMASR
jgi:solute carrier family 25 (mitochondrial thiamine pyrophosphate transporter), member 19